MPRVGITLKLRGVKEAQITLRRLSIEAMRLVRECVARSTLTVERQAKRSVSVDTGRLKTSLRATYSADRLRGRAGVFGGPTASYALYVERGTRPHWPPVEALKPWARRVLHDESAAFLVARAISKRGTKAKPYLEPAFKDEVPRFLRCMRGIGRQLEVHARV